jgi:hypothetical protein
LIDERVEQPAGRNHCQAGDDERGFIHARLRSACQLGRVERGSKALFVAIVAGTLPKTWPADAG